jgi:hypothetical protein
MVSRAFLKMWGYCQCLCMNAIVNLAYFFTEKEVEDVTIILGAMWRAYFEGLMGRSLLFYGN